MRKTNVRYLAASVLLLASSNAAPPDEKTETPIVLEPLMISGDLIGRSWLETGTSVEVLNEKDLENRAGQNSVRDILENATNVTMPIGTGKGPTIRGIDGTGAAENANAFFAGSRARVGLNIDGRPANYNEIVFGNSALWDVERVELLRGPQSTLVGRNAIAGTLTIKTNDPVFDTEAAFQTSVGNFDSKQISGMVNGVFVDNVVAGRLAFDVRSSESSVNYTPYDGVSNPGDIESINLRGKLLIHPNIGQYSTLRLTAARNSFKSPNSEIIVKPFDDKVSNFPQQPVHITTTNSIVAEFEVELSDEWQLEIDTSVTDFSFERKTAPGSSAAAIDSYEFSIDPRLRWYGENGFEALFGIHAFIADQDETILLVADQAFEDKVNTYAAYGEIIVPVLDNVNVTVGGRYEVERHRRSGGDAAGAVATIDFEETYKEFLPRFDINWKASKEQSYGFLVSKGYNAGGGGISFGSPIPFPIIHYTYDKETVWNTEIYGRQTLFGGALKLSENVFYSRYKDMQLPFDLTPNNSADELFVVRRADRTTVYGAEFGANLTLDAGVEIFGNLGLLKTKVNSFPGSGVEGNQLLTAPNFTANLGANWTYNGFLTSVTTRYTNGYYTDINNRPRGQVDPYFVTDAKIAYEIGNLQLFGEVSNIFDTQAFISRYPNESSSALDTAVLIQPRTFKFGATVKF